MKLITLLLIGFIATPVFAQVATPPAQPSDFSAPAPLFRVTVVGRTTAAITYRPRSRHTKVDLVGAGCCCRRHADTRKCLAKRLDRIDAASNKCSRPRVSDPRT